MVGGLNCGAWNLVKKLLNLETQNIKVVSYDIWNSQLRLEKNQEIRDTILH